MDSTSAGVGIGFAPNLNGRVKLEKIAKEKVSERSAGGVHHSPFWRGQRHTPAQRPPQHHHHPAFRTGPDTSHSSCSCVLRSSVSTATQHPPPSTDVSRLSNNKSSQRQHEEAPPTPSSGCGIPQTSHDQMENLFLMATAQRCSSWWRLCCCRGHGRRHRGSERTPVPATFMLFKQEEKTKLCKLHFHIQPSGFWFVLGFFFFFKDAASLLLLIILSKQGNHLFQEVDSVYHGGGWGGVERGCD